MATDLGIVILNWNTCDLLKRCLETVYASEGDFSYRVVVVDNASPDDSVQMVRADFPQAELIVSPINGGYPYGNNLGLRALGYQDSRRRSARCAALRAAAQPGYRSAADGLSRNGRLHGQPPRKSARRVPNSCCSTAASTSPAAGVFPPRLSSLYHFSGLGKLFPNSPRFARYNMTYLPVDQEAEVDSVVGAYMQVRREVIEAVGLLDEAFFMYGEDLDWAYRIKNAGWSVVYHPQVVVKHVKRAASRQSQRAQFEFWRAMLIFYRKHYRTTTPLWLHSLIMMGLLLKGGRTLWREVRRTTP